MAAAFLHDNLIPAAVFIGNLGTAQVAALPLSNLSDPQPRVRSRWQPATAGIYVDFGSTVTISCVALIGTTLGTLGGSPLMSIQFGHDAGFGTSTWATGAFDPQTSAAAGGNVIVVNATSASGRYMILTLSDADASYLDVGRLVVGPLWRLEYGFSYGVTEGRLMLDRRDRNSFTGAEFPVPAVTNPRMTTFTLPLISDAEAIGEYRTMRDTLGAAGDALWIPDATLALAELNQRCIWGGVAEPGASLLSRATFLSHSRNFTIVERV